MESFCVVVKNIPLDMSEEDLACSLLALMQESLKNNFISCEVNLRQQLAILEFEATTDLNLIGLLDGAKIKNNIIEVLRFNVSLNSEQSETTVPLDKPVLMEPMETEDHPLASELESMDVDMPVLPSHSLIPAPLNSASNLAANGTLNPFAIPQSLPNVTLEKHNASVHIAEQQHPAATLSQQHPITQPPPASATNGQQQLVIKPAPVSNANSQQYPIIKQAPVSDTNGHQQLKQVPVSTANSLQQLDIKSAPACVTNSQQNPVIKQTPESATNTQQQLVIQQAPVSATNGQQQLVIKQAPVGATNGQQQLVIKQAPVSATNGQQQLVIKQAPVGATNGQQQLVIKQAPVSATNGQQQLVIKQAPVSATNGQQQLVIKQAPMSATNSQQQLVIKQVPASTTNSHQQLVIKSVPVSVTNSQQNQIIKQTSVSATNGQQQLVIKQASVSATNGQQQFIIKQVPVSTTNSQQQLVIKSSPVSSTNSQQNPIIIKQVSVTNSQQQLFIKQVPVSTTNSPQNQNIRQVPVSTTNSQQQHVIKPVPVSTTNSQQQHVIKPVPVSTANSQQQHVIKPVPVSSTNRQQNLIVNPAPVSAANDQQHLGMKPEPTSTTNQQKRLIVQSDPVSTTIGQQNTIIKAPPVSASNGAVSQRITLPRGNAAKQKHTPRVLVPNQITNTIKPIVPVAKSETASVKSTTPAVTSSAAHPAAAAANTIVGDIPLVFFDLETTGLLKHKHCEVVQVAAKCGPKVYNCFIMPLHGVPAAASAVNNLKVVRGKLKKSNKIVETIEPLLAWKGFLNFLRECGEEVGLIGHNAHGFDYILLVRELVGLGLLKDLLSVVKFGSDTLPLFQEKLPYRSNHRQVDMANEFKINTTNAHDAIGDITMLEELCMKLGVTWSDVKKHAKSLQLLPNSIKSIVPAAKSETASVKSTTPAVTSSAAHPAAAAANTIVGDIPLVFFDLETTGLLKHKHCEVVQVAAKCGPKVYNCFIMPLHGIPAAASAVNNLKVVRGKLKKSNKIVETIEPLLAWKGFLNFLRECGEEVGLIGHNAHGFDYILLVRELLGLGLLKDLLSVVKFGSDTLPLFQEKLPYRSNHRQVDMANEFKINTTNAHDAIGDITMLEELCMKLGVTWSDVKKYAKSLQLLPNSIKSIVPAAKSETASVKSTTPAVTSSAAHPAAAAANTIVGDIPLVFFDLETTGLLKHKHCEVVQVAAKCGPKVYNCFIMPLHGVPAAASAVNNLKVVRGKLKKSNKIVETIEPLLAWKGFLNFLRECGEEVGLIGHNAHGFDYILLVRELQGLGLLQDLLSVVKFGSDTLPLFQEKLPYRSNHRQVDMANEFKINTNNAHDAIGDITMLEGLCMKLGVTWSDVKKHAKSLQLLPNSIKSIVPAAKSETASVKSTTPAVTSSAAHPAAAAANTIVGDIPLVFFDLETTGLLKHKHCEVVQVAAKCGPKVYNCFIMPLHGVPAAASAVNNLKVVRGKLKKSNKIVETIEPLLAWKGFLNFLRECGEEVGLIGHNAHGFDYILLVRELQGLGLLQDLLSVVKFGSDTLPLFQEKLPYRSNHRQVDMANEFKINTNNAHDAIGDITMLEELCMKLGVTWSDVKKHAKLLQLVRAPY